MSRNLSASASLVAEFAGGDADVPADAANAESIIDPAARDVLPLLKFLNLAFDLGWGQFHGLILVGVGRGSNPAGWVVRL